MTEGVVQRTRQELLHELETSQAQVVRLLESVAAVQDWQPESAEWSFRLIAGHLATVEETWHLRRVLDIAGGDTPHIAAYSNHSVDFAEQELTASLAQWTATRQRLLAYVAGLREADLQRVGVHETLGPMSIMDILAEILRQDQVNLRHIHQLVVAYYEATPLASSPAGAVLPAQSSTADHNEAQ